MPTARNRKTKSKPKERAFVCSLVPTVTATVVRIPVKDGYVAYRVTISAPDRVAVQHKIFRDTEKCIQPSWREDRPLRSARDLAWLGWSMDEAVQRLMCQYADVEPLGPGWR